MAEHKFDVFISHASADSSDARRLAEELRGTGKSVFLEEQSLNPGEDWEQSITASLEQSSNVVVLVSCNSLASQSSSYEMGLAVGHAKRTPGVHLLPVALDQTAFAAMPIPLRAVQWIDASKSLDGAVAAIEHVLASDESDK